jgi:hypothetical protein
MRSCLVCDAENNGPCFRLRIGGVLHDEVHGVQFTQRPEDHFEDGTQTKWVCQRCAANAGIFIEELETEYCLGPNDDGDICGEQFQPDTEDDSECVLLIEWGQMEPSDKGPGEMFLAHVSKHIHFWCACNGWTNLKLESIGPTDCP